MYYLNRAIMLTRVGGQGPANTCLLWQVSESANSDVYGLKRGVIFRPCASWFCSATVPGYPGRKRGDKGARYWRCLDVCQSCPDSALQLIWKESPLYWPSVDGRRSLRCICRTFPTGVKICTADWGCQCGCIRSAIHLPRQYSSYMEFDLGSWCRKRQTYALKRTTYSSRR